MDGLEIKVAGSYPIKFGSGLTSTGPENGEHQDGMELDVWCMWGDRRMFSGGVMSYADVLRLKSHIEAWLEMRLGTLTNQNERK